MNISNTITVIRNVKGLSQEELAKKVGLSKSLISRIESGQRTLSEKNKLKICQNLDIPKSLFDLLSLEEAESFSSKQYEKIGRLLLQIIDKNESTVSENTVDSNEVFRVYTLRHLAKILGEKESVLKRVTLSKNQFYRPTKELIKNKLRDIDRPIGLLKKIQTKIDKRMLKKISLPDILCGGVKGKSIKDSAQVHLNQPIVVDLDIKDCFPNVRSNEILKTFKRVFKCSDKVAKMLTDLTTYEGHLPQGGTHSNTLLNLVLIPLCEDLIAFAKEHQLAVSIWVDGIIFSGEDAHEYIPNFMGLVKKYKLKINKTKIKVMRSNKPQIVNGLTVNTKKVGVLKKQRAQYRSFIIDNPSDLKAVGYINFIEFINKNQARTVTGRKSKISN